MVGTEKQSHKHTDKHAQEVTDIPRGEHTGRGMARHRKEAHRAEKSDSTSLEEAASGVFSSQTEKWSLKAHRK